MDKGAQSNKRFNGLLPECDMKIWLGGRIISGQEPIELPQSVCFTPTLTSLVKAYFVDWL
jgi:hypothetical protein